MMLSLGAIEQYSEYEIIQFEDGTFLHGYWSNDIQKTSDIYEAHRFSGRDLHNG